MHDERVGVAAAMDSRAAYGVAPFDPPPGCPEFGDAGRQVASGPTVYPLIREALSCLDRPRFGTPRWNPLGGIVAPGQRVVLKPNLVVHDRIDGEEVRTHAAVIRCLLEYAFIAMGGSGRVVICDAPIQGADFGRLVTQSGLDQVVEVFDRRPGFGVSLVDLRAEWARVDDASAFIRERVQLPGDPAGDTLFDLGAGSALEPVSGGGSRLAVGDYSAAFTSQNHQPGRHRYRFSNTVLDADVVLNVAKMKTHQKAGVSGALKNVVGMNTSKDHLPHFRMGPPPDGDEYPRSAYNRFAALGKAGLQERVPLPLWRGLRRGAESVQRLLRRRRGGEARYGLLSGSWEGNDTIWRMVVDINRIARFGGRGGELAPAPSRRLYHFVDGIVAGDGEGPLRPRPRSVGVFLHGGDAVVVDALMAVLMGFDPVLVPQLRATFECGYGLTASRSLADARILLGPSLIERLGAGEHLDFQAPRGWPNLGRSVSADLLRGIAERAAGLQTRGGPGEPA